MHAVGIWCKTKIQIDPGGLEVNFSLQEKTESGRGFRFYVTFTLPMYYNIVIDSAAIFAYTERYIQF